MSDWHKLRPLFERYPTDVQPTCVQAFERASGFSGAQIWQATSPAGPLCLRRWPAEHPTEERLRFIHAVLQHVQSHGFDPRILPLPIHTQAGATYVQHDKHWWQLEPWLPGEPCGPANVPASGVGVALATLAGLHTVLSEWPATHGRLDRPPAIVDRLTALRSLCHEEGRALIAAAQPMAHSPAPDPVWARPVRAVAQALQAAAARVLPQLEKFATSAAPIFPCLRDIHADHLLFLNGRVSGIVDWGAVRVESPLADVARLLGSLARDDRRLWEEGLRAYAALRPLPEAWRRMVRVLDASGTVLGAANWIRWLCVDRRTFPDSAAVVLRLELLASRQQHLLSDPQLD